MKKAAYVLLIAVVFFSCKKSDTPSSQPNKIKYSLEFEVGDEEQTNYEIQTSLTGNNFQKVAFIPYNPNKKGAYQVDLTLELNEKVRIKSIDRSGEVVYSWILVAR